MMKEKILVIDDEVGIRSSLKGVLEDEGYFVETAESGKQGLDLLEKDNFDLVLLDIWLPEMDGVDVLKTIKELNGDYSIIMISGHGNVETAVKTTKLGAYDFLEKPLTLEKVVLTVKNALRQKNLEEENILLREEIRDKFHFIGKDPSINKLKKEINLAAPTNGCVLISGENGTGKELIARLIHQNSPRKNKRFIPINSAAIPDDLLEIELFGYNKASSSKTEKDKKGKILLSDGGTLFLDQISEMSLKIQSKLEKIIEEHKFEPLGSYKSVPINVRFIAATNVDLRKLKSNGKFRENLYYKLNVIPIHIPPLRERKDDIPLLINYFLKYFSLEYGKKQKSMSKDAMKAFVNYSWPGNINELSNVIERFVIMVEEEKITSSHLSLLVEPRESKIIQNNNKDKSLKQASEQFEKEYIHQALLRNNWDLASTASELEINKESLSKKIELLNISLIE
ncbi:MAG: sigma-54-dependent transcriptional regulator [Candidatus Aminicenantaceae bacterium]